ncbi:lamin tail domain-containing protein [Patescibacteria group bacterium]|nr:lamin tail domain-containing protein [Patescibacteria group bacterium]MBU1755013.1 lamin tail domain-containing protein [Patescibacteria group bacterium]
MYRYIRTVLLVGSLIAASQAEAAILINEVAWMGSDIENGSSCEWVELYNPDTLAVNLSSWSLSIANSGGSTPKVITISELDGFGTVLEPNAFYILARDSGVCLEHMPGNTANWSGSFGTGISNTGSTVTLRDSAGITIDAVDASEGWGEIGGYNVSGRAKLTPQRNGTGWVTAAPTPGAVNATQSESVDTESTTSKSTSSTKKTSPPKIYVEAGGDRTVSTNADTDYRALVYTDQGRIVRTAKMLWTYGEGSSDRAAAGYHKYREPGEYLVHVQAQDGWRVADDTFIVLVDDAEIDISDVSEKGVALRNFDSRILDMSYWKLLVDGIFFRIPQGTYILPGRTVYFSPEVTGLPISDSASLLYPGGNLHYEYKVATSTDDGRY